MPVRAYISPELDDALRSLASQIASTATQALTTERLAILGGLGIDILKPMREVPPTASDPLDVLLVLCLRLVDLDLCLLDLYAQPSAYWTLVYAYYKPLLCLLPLSFLPVKEALRAVGSQPQG